MLGPRGVGKHHLLQFHAGAACRPGRLLRLRWRGHIGATLQQGHQALGGACGAQQIAIDLAQHGKGTGQQQHVNQGLAQLASGGGASANRQGPQVQAPQQHRARGHHHKAHQHRARANAANRRLHRLLAGLHKALALVRFGGVGLHHRNGIEHLAGQGAGIGQAVLVGAREAAHPPAQVDAGQDDGQQHGNHLQHQPGIAPHQHQQGAQAHHQIAQAHGQRRAHHGLHQGGVIGQA